MKGNFQVNISWFFAFFSCVFDWTVLILTWFERSLHSAQVSGQKFPWPLKLMTSQAEEGMWIHTGGYGRLRGEWVNRVSTRITSLLLAVWASTVTATSKNVTMITFGLNLPLSSLTLFRPGLFYASRYPGGGGVLGRPRFITRSSYGHENYTQNNVIIISNLWA